MGCCARRTLRWAKVGVLGDVVPGSPDEDVGTDTKAQRHSGSDATVFASKGAKPDVTTGRNYAPDHDAVRLKADIDAILIDRPPIVVDGHAGASVIDATDAARRTENKAQIAGDIAFEKSCRYATLGEMLLPAIHDAGHCPHLLDGFILTVLIAVAIGTIYYAIRLVKELRRSIRR